MPRIKATIFLVLLGFGLVAQGASAQIGDPEAIPTPDPLESKFQRTHKKYRISERRAINTSMRRFDKLYDKYGKGDLKGDLNRDQVVNDIDLNLLGSCLGAEGKDHIALCRFADLNNDVKVDVLDAGILGRHLEAHRVRNPSGEKPIDND